MEECESCGVVSTKVALYEFALGEEYEEHGTEVMWCPDCTDDDYVLING
jgi:hypothetical protein